ncbi:MAG: glycosyltransferase family 4 protein [Acidimicrobiales bacterium]|nr:glycosyltransferase family 4 protein [Acidimicrobiales bacterium]MCB1261218.1 glycosyltransferase family 4 protein [Acidimicrobiales bacterium]
MPVPLRVAVTLEQCWHRVPGGTATSALRSTAALAARRDVEVVGVAARHDGPPPEDLRPTVPVRHVPLPRAAMYESWHLLHQPRIERTTGPVDVVHATGMAVPPTAAPLVVTVHDLAFLHDPTQFTRRGVRFFHQAIELARRSASLVVCPSEATMADCVAHGFDPDRLRLVPWGVDADQATDEAVDRVRAAHGLARRYVLWVGTIEPRKNLETLLDAFGRVDPDVDLVLAGPSGWHTDLAARLERLGPRARALGFVPANDLPALMAGADVLCYPSVREGFGMPVLEAMAQTTAIVTSAGTAMAELVAPPASAPAGVLVDPTDAVALGHELNRVLGDDALRAAYGVAGRALAEGRSWERTAGALVECYREATQLELVAPARRTGPAPRSSPGRRSAAARAARNGVARIGWNLLWLDPGVVGGSEEYTVRLLDALLDEAPPDLRITAFVNRNLLAAYPALWDRLDTVVAPVSGSSRIARIAAESTWLAYELDRRDITLTHHLGGTVPVLRRGPVVVTIHDLQPLAMPEHFRRLKRAYIHRALPFAVRHASRIVTLTDYTRADIVARLGARREQVALVPSGIDVPAEAPTPAEIDAVLARYELVDRPFFVYPAITYPHKNHATLLHAFAGVLRHRSDAVLVLTSGAAQSEPDIRATADRLGIRHALRRPGRIPRGDLDTLYWAATGLVFPSRFEGFGLPVLEAMARRCPVVAAATTALPEVVGDAGMLVAPLDAAGWRDAMCTLLDDPALGDRLRAAGVARARAYGWSRAVDQLCAVYREEVAGL